MWGNSTSRSVAMLLGSLLGAAPVVVLAATLSTRVAGEPICSVNANDPASSVDICYVDTPARPSLSGTGGDTFDFGFTFGGDSMTLGRNTNLSLGLLLSKQQGDPRPVFIDEVRVAPADRNGGLLMPWVSLGSVDAVQGCRASGSCGYGIFPDASALDGMQLFGVRLQVVTRALDSGIGIRFSLRDASVRGGNFIGPFPSPLIFHTIGAQLTTRASDARYLGSASLTDLDGNGYPDTAFLRVLLPLFQPQVMIRDAFTGRNVRFLPAFDRNWEVVAIASLDSNLDSIPEVAVLARHRNRGTVQVLIRDALSGAVVRRLGFFGDGWEPKSLSTQDVDLDGYDDVSVLATSERRGISAIATRSVQTGRQIKWLSLRPPNR